MSGQSGILGALEQGKIIYYIFKGRHGNSLSKCKFLSLLELNKWPTQFPFHAKFPPHQLNPPNLPHTTISSWEN